MRSLPLALASGLLLTGLLAGCTDDGDGGDRQADPTPAEVLAQAKQKLDETSGVRLEVTSEDLPEDITGLVSATGVLTRAPGFDGSIVVQYAGFTPEVPVVAVDGKVYAQLPLTTGWQEIDPAEYGAPDPAALMDPATGLSSFLTATTGVTEGDSVRGGANNSEVLTSYSGTLPAATAAVIVPSVAGNVAATYAVNDGGELRSAQLVGDFYGTGAESTYVLTVDDYGTEQDITAP